MAVTKTNKVKLDAATIEVFVESFLKKHFVDEAAIPECHREWWEMCCSNHKYVALAAPRGHAKSTAITLSYGLASLVFRERKFLIILSDTYDQACLFLGNIKRELQENEELKAMFGVKDFIKDTEGDIIVEFVDGYKCRVMAKGAEQKLRGLNWDGTRPDLILGDDMENDEIVLNADRREKFKRWFIGAVTPSLSKHGVIRIVGTILHQDSLLENYMPKAWDKKAGNTQTPLKLISNFNRSFWWAAKYKAHPAIGDYSELLWPEYKTKEGLMLEYQTQKNLGLGDVYAQEQLNEPIDESTSLFRKADFAALREEDKESAKNFYIGFDLATKSDTVRTDKTSFTVGGVDSSNTLNIVYHVAERMDSKEAAEMILQLQRLYEPVAFITEKGALINSIEPFLKVLMYETNTFPSIITYTARTDKVERSSSIRARMRAGGVRFDKNADWFDPLQNECLQFPRSIHNDQVDSLAWLGIGLNKLIEAPTVEELNEEQYQQDLEESGSNDEGRSSITGY